MIKSKPVFLKTILLGLLASVCFYQKTSAQSASKFNWTTDSEFLPQNSIKSIVPDKYGFIWMTTENGLVRYDGKNFQVYNSYNFDLKSNRFFYIVGNYQSDSLYTATDWDEQLVFINKRKIQLVDGNTHPNAIQFDRNDRENRFTSSGIPSILLDIPKRPYHIPLISRNYYHIDNDMVRFYNAKKKLQYALRFEYESNSNFFAIGDELFYMQKDGRYAIIRDGKVTWHALDVNPKAKNDLYWNTVARQVFLHSDRTLYLLDYQSGELKKSILVEEEELDIKRINTIYFDKDNKIIYLGSKSKGLGIYKMKKFKTLTPSDPDTSDIFYALTPFENNTIISGTGVVMNSEKILQNFNLESDRYTIALDNDKNIWLYKGSKLNHFRKEDNYKQQFEWKFDRPITSLFRDKKGQIWFSLYKKETGSIYHFVPGKNPVFHKFASINFHPEFITEKENNTLLIGSSQGLYSLDLATKKIYHYKETRELKIRSVFISSKKDIWITTYEKGFFLLKNGKLHSFPLDRYNYLLSSHCIVEDRNGFFWISSNKGLFQVKEKSLLDYAAKKVTAIYYHYYNKDAGFLTNEFNGGCQPCATRLGSTVFFPSMSGVVTFNPEETSPNLPRYAIFIDEALIDNQKVSLGDTLYLNRKFDRITLFINSPYYGNNNNLNFEAKLEGDDYNEWTKVSDENNISFTHLSPGEYQFIVRKLSGFDSKYEYKKITLIIEPAFWETVWFKILLFILLVLAGIVFYNLRIQFIVKKNLLLEKKIDDQTRNLKDTISTLRATKENLNQQIENNTKIIQYITHDIKSPLKFMAMASKYMYDSFEENDPELKNNIQSIYTSSSQMYNFVDNLLGYSKAYLDKGGLYFEEVKPYAVIAEKITLFESIAYSKKIAIKNLVNPTTTLKGNKQLFSIIIHNLLDNALKNTLSGSIFFYDSEDQTQTYISIRDTGIGMQPSVIDYYMTLMEHYDTHRSKNNNRIGLHVVVELLLILNGKMSIVSSKNNGTVFTLAFQKDS